MTTTIIETQLPLPLVARGKVRDIYDLGENLLMVTSDRLSAFDVVLPNPIPMKGIALTQISRFWFDRTRSWLPNHLIADDWDSIRGALNLESPDPYRDALSGRTMITVKAKPFPVECVVRGYLAGSLWAEYKAAGGPDQAATLHNIPLPAGLRNSERLPQPLFTPATKATTGHDENISFERMIDIVGQSHAEQLRDLSVRLYLEAAEYATSRGLIIADTKFEFGLYQDRIILIDEALTPDSSRYWDAESYEPGRSQPSFDKQYVRDYLEEIGWDKNPPAPTLPDEVVRVTSEKYCEAYRRITGRELQP